MLIWNPPLAPLHHTVMNFMINKNHSKPDQLTLISGGSNNAHRVPINWSNKIILSVCANMTDYCSDILKLMYAIICMHYKNSNIWRHIHTDKHTCTHTLFPTHSHAHARIQSYTHKDKHKRTHTCTNKHTHIHTHTHTHTNIHMYTYTQTTTEYSSDYLASDEWLVISCTGTGDILPITSSDQCSYKTLQWWCTNGIYNIVATLWWLKSNK